MNLADMNERVTRHEAALLAGVSDRTISRWAAAGRLKVLYVRTRTGAQATYDPDEVEACRALRDRTLRGGDTGSV